MANSFGNNDEERESIRKAFEGGAEYGMQPLDKGELSDRESISAEFDDIETSVKSERDSISHMFDEMDKTKSPFEKALDEERRQQAELDARYKFRNKSRDPQQPAPAEEPSNRPFTPSELIPQGEARPDELLKESLNEAAGEGRKKLDFAERTGLRPVLKPLEQPKTEADRKRMDELETQAIAQRRRKDEIDERVRSGGEVRGFERFTRLIDDPNIAAPTGDAPTIFDVPVLTKIPGIGQVIALANRVKEDYVKKRIKQNAYSNDALGQAQREADLAIVQADEAFDSELQKRGTSWRTDVAAGIGTSALWMADAMIVGPSKSLIKYGRSARWAERIVPHLSTAGRRGLFHIPTALADALDRMQAKGLQVTPEGKAFFEYEGEGWLKAFSKAIAMEAVEQLSETFGEILFGPTGNVLARNLPASQRLVRMFLGTLDDPKTLAQNPSMLSNVISGLFPEWLEERASSFGHAIFNLDERPGVELTTKERWQVFPATWREAGIELGVLATITGATAAGGIGPALERHAKAVRRTENADKYRAIHHELLNVDTSNISDRDTELMKRAEWAIGAGQQRVVDDAVELMSEPARAVWDQMTFNAEVKLARTNAARKILPEVKPFTSPETTDMQRNESTGQNEYTDINSRMKIVETVPGKQFMVQNVEGEDIATTETLAGAEAVARDYVARRMAREVVGFQRETMTMGVNGETVIDAYKDESSGVAYQVNNTTGKATVFDENGKAVATDLTPADARKKATEIALQQQDVDIEEEVNRETRDARARLAAQIASNMIEGAEVVTFESHEELLGRPDHEIPAIVKERIRGDYAQRTPAFVYEDKTTGKSTVFIALDAVGNGFDMIQALSHEAGHYGVGMKMVAGEAMGDTTKTLNDFLQEISGEHGLEILDDKVREIMADDAMLQDLEESLIQRHRDAAIRRLRARKDLSREQRAAQAQAIQEQDFDVSGGMTLRVLEEAIVEIQEGIGISADSYDRFVNALHKRINKTGSMMNKTFGTNLGLQAKMTRADLKVLLDNARKAARKGPEGFKRNDKEYSVKLYEKRKSPEERRTERKAQAAQNRAQGAGQAGVAPAAANGETPAAGTPAKPSDVSDGTVKNKRARQNAITPEQDAAYLDAVENDDTRFRRAETPDVEREFASLTSTLKLPKGTRAERQAALDEWIKGNPKEYAALEKLRGDVLKAAGYNVGPVYNGMSYDPGNVYKKGLANSVIRVEGVDRNNFGFFFTESKQQAGHYAGDSGIVKASHLRAGKELDLSKLESTAPGEDVESTLAFAGVDFDIDASDEVEVWRHFLDGDKAFSDAIRKAGYDSIRFNEPYGYGDREAYVVFDSTQIKSADPLALDDSGELITPRRWAEEDTADIRFRRPAVTPEQDAAFDDFVEMYSEAHDEAIGDFVREFRSSANGRVASWPVVPAGRLKKIWTDHARMGFVRDEAGMDGIARKMIGLVARLEAATEILGHTQIDAREELLESMGYEFTDKEWDRFQNFLTAPSGQWRLSDYGMKPLQGLARELAAAKSAEEQLVIVDRMLNVTHQRGDMAENFVEGGKETLGWLANQTGDTRFKRSKGNKLLDVGSISSIIDSRFAPVSPTGVNVEVAPDPNAEALNERWRALPLAVRDDATRRIASSVLPRMLHEIGIDDVELEYTRGTFEGNYNPTIIMRFTPQATWETKRRAAIASGALLRQQSVIVFDEGITEGDNLGSFFKVVPDRVMSDDEMSALNDGMFVDFRAGSGLTLRDGSMVFGNFTGYSDTPMTDEQFRLALSAALGKHIPADVTIDVPMNPSIFKSEYIDDLDGAKGADGVVLDETLQKWYGALATKGDAEDASQVSRDDVEAGRDDLRKRIGSFRSIQAEAESVLNAFIDGTPGADQLAGEAGDAAPDRGGEGGTIRNLRSDRKAVVFHWGREGLTETDPTYQGTGSQGAERKRQFNRPKDYVPRTYFGGAQYAKTPEFPKGTPKYSAELDTSRIVVLGDLTPEEQKIWARARAAGGGEFAPDSVTFFEKGLKRAGYLGWYDPDADVYAIFEKVPVKPVGAGRVSSTTLKFAKPYSGKKLTLAQLAATAPVAAPAAQTPPAAGMPQQAAAPLPAVSVIQAAAQAAAQAQATPAMPQQPVAGAATMPPPIPQALVPFKQAMHRPNKVLKGPPSQANAIQYIYRGLASLAGNISKDIAILLRSMEQRIGTLDTDFDKAIMPISHRYKKLSEPRGERRAFDSAVMQGEPQNVSAMAAYFGIPDAEYLAVRERLDFIENRARALGLKFGHVDNYWPRKVKDYDGLRLAMEQLYGITSNVIDSALAKAEHEKGAPLTEFEQGDVVAAMAHGNQKSGGLGNLKERKLQFIPDELQDYYEDSMTTAMTYAHAMHEQIAIREFLGKMSPAYRVQVEMAKAWMNDPANQGVTPPPQVTQMLATDFGVGHALLDLHQRGVLDAGDVSKLNQILSSRFAPRHTPVAIRRAMNATMGMFLVQAKSTIRQLQDLHNPVGAAGAFWGTVGIAKAATRNLLRVKPGATYMRLEDLGVSPSDAWKRDSVANKAIEMGFNAIGFSLLDRLGKEALVNAKMSQLRSLATRAQHGSLSAARKLDREVFRLFTGMPSQKVKDRLAATNVHGAPVITDESKQAGYQTLAIYTPISRSEMPLLWQKGGMYGAMYQFKSYLISFHNAWVDMGIRQLKEAGEAGDTAGQAEAIRNMVMMPVYFTTFGFLTSMLIQALFNRDDEPEEVLYGEFLQTLGSNRYMTYKAKVGEWQELLSGFLMPALSPATDIGRDVADVVQGKIDHPLDMRMARSFPGFGSIIYAWYGRGSKEWKAKNDAKRKAEKKENPRKSGGSKRSKTTLKLLSDD